MLKELIDFKDKYINKLVKITYADDCMIFKRIGKVFKFDISSTFDINSTINIHIIDINTGDIKECNSADIIDFHLLSEEEFINEMKAYYKQW